MGKLVSIGCRSIVTAAGGATLEILGLGTYKPRIRRIEFAQVTAVAGTYGLGFAAAAGVTPTSPATLLEERATTYDPKTRIALAWVTPPTVPAAFFRRATCAAAVGAAVVWDFGSEGLQMDDVVATSSLVLWVIATAPVLDINIVVDE